MKASDIPLIVDALAPVFKEIFASSNKELADGLNASVDERIKSAIAAIEPTEAKGSDDLLRELTDALNAS